MDRELELLRNVWGGGEHSKTSCRVERACPDARRATRAPVEGTFARCELAAGIPRVPALFRRVATMYRPITSESGLWLLHGMSSALVQIPNLVEPVRDAVCCDGCGAELSCVNSGR